MTEANVAMKANIPGMISGAWPSYTLDYTKAVLAKGTVALPYAPQGSVTGTDVEITWTDNSGIGNALANDTINVLAFNATRNQAVVNMDTVTRSERNITVSCPANWTGDTIYVYLFAKRHDLSDTSDSTFIGTYTI